MPQFNVKAPDGSIIPVNAPEGATEQDAIAFAASTWKPGSAPQPSATSMPIEQSTPPPHTLMESSAARMSGLSGLNGIAETGAGLVTGTGAQIAGGLRGLYGLATGDTADQAAKKVTDTTSRYTYEPRSAEGKTLNAVIAAPSNFANQKLGQAGGAVGGFMNGEQGRIAGQAVGENVLPVVGTLLGGKALLGRAPMMNEAAQAGIRNYADAAYADAATQNALNAPKAAIVDRALASKLKIPPSSVNHSFLNKRTEGLAGKVATQQDASIANQPIMNSKVRADFGLPDNTLLLPETYNAVRKDAFDKGYVPLNNLGKLATDKQFSSDLNAIKTLTTEDYGPITNNAKVNDLVTALSRSSMQGSDAVALMRKLRDDANNNLAFGVTDAEQLALGKAQKKAAAAIENMVGRRLQDMHASNPSAGYGDMAQNFTDARKTIAKSFTAQKATDAVTGNVMAQKLADRLQSRKPIEGGMRDVAEFAKIAHKAVQLPEKVGSPVSATEAMAGSILGTMGYHGLGMEGLALGALPLARPLTRSAILSDLYQNRMARVPVAKPSVAARIGRAIAGTDESVAAPSAAKMQQPKLSQLMTPETNSNLGKPTMPTDDISAMRMAKSLMDKLGQSKFKQGKDGDLNQASAIGYLRQIATQKGISPSVRAQIEGMMRDIPANSVRPPPVQNNLRYLTQPTYSGRQQ